MWVDAHLAPALAQWMAVTFGIEAVAVREIGLRDAEDPRIFAAAREAGVALLTKDSDFVELLTRLGPPPQVIPFGSRVETRAMPPSARFLSARGPVWSACLRRTE